MTNQNVGLGSLGLPGIYMNEISTSGLRNHLDIPYVTALRGAKTEKGLSLGTLDLYALQQIQDSPLLTLNIENAGIIYTNEDFYTFELNSATDLTNRLVSGGLDKDSFGEDGEEFPIICTRRDLSPGAIFKFDLFSPISFLVVDRKPDTVNSHFRVWARLNKNSEVSSVTKADFQPNRPIYKIADIRGLDFSSYESVWGITGPSKSKYKNYLTNVKLQQSYIVSTGAVEFLNSDPGMSQEQLRSMADRVVQLYQLTGDGKGTKIIRFADLSPAEKAQAQERIASQMMSGMGHATMANMLDSITVRLMLQQNNNIIMWSSAIDSLSDGYDTMRVNPGIWFQLDLAGYKHGYDIETFSLEGTLGAAIRDFEFGKTAIRDSLNTQVYKIKTGRGGKALIEDGMLKAGYTMMGQIMNSDHGFIKGDANNLTVMQPRITRYQLKNVGIIEVEYEPGFDPIVQDEIANPILATGERLSSYTMLIEAADMSANNIKIIRKTDSRIRMIVENGDESHPMFKSNRNVEGQNISVHQGTDRLTGYKVRFVGNADTGVVMDPTRLLKLVPNNPKLGRANL